MDPRTSVTLGCFCRIHFGIALKLNALLIVLGLFSIFVPW